MSTKSFPEIGDKMPDGTIFAGVSPDTDENMFITPQDAPGIFKWKEAMKYAANLDAHGHRDWRLPTKAELDVLHQNRDRGALKGTFNESGSHFAGWYWSSNEHPAYAIRGNLAYADKAWAHRFSRGNRCWSWKGFDASVRPVRLEPAAPI